MRWVRVLILVVSTILFAIISFWRIESVQQEKDNLENEIIDMELYWYDNYHIEMDVLQRLFFDYEYDDGNFIERITKAYPEIQIFWDEFSLTPEMLSAVVITEQTENGKSSIYIDTARKKISEGYPEELAAYFDQPEQDEEFIPYMEALPIYLGSEILKHPFIRISGKGRTCLILLDYELWKNQLTKAISNVISENPMFDTKLFSIKIMGGGQELADELAESEADGYPLTSLSFDSGGYGDLASNNYAIPEIYAEDAGLNYTAAARVRMRSIIDNEDEVDPFDPGDSIDVEGVSVWAVFNIDKSAIALEALRIQLGGILLSYAAVILLVVLLFILAGHNRRTTEHVKEQQIFIANISHELRTPLAVICNAGTNLADGFIQEPEKIQTYGKVIADEGNRLSGMVEGILMYSGFQLGKITKEPFEVDDLAQLLIKRFTLLCREKGIQFKSEISEGLKLYADKEGVIAAVSNLLRNAIIHGGNGGLVFLRIQESADKHFIEIRVSDNGPGINKIEQKRIFEPFVRGNETTRLAVPGSGLGLSLVKQVAILHGGTVELKSNLGEGAEFILSLENNAESGEING
ncbi:MAG: HAMP domain-containing sensor histidine kinase [Spirochaetales bacterium]|nr:HAMP domain-containing sensor histidine kinase [Spirochaetales bacterium]